MNYRLVARFLGILALLMGAFMLLSLAWAFPELGQRTDARLLPIGFETKGFWGLVWAAAISGALGLALWAGAGKTPLKIYRKEALAIVGLGWLLATVLGALPYVLSGTQRGLAARVDDSTGKILIPASRWDLRRSWQEAEGLSDIHRGILRALVLAGPRGLTHTELQRHIGSPMVVTIALDELQGREPWDELILSPGQYAGPHYATDISHYRIAGYSFGMIDAMFEAQSGFSTTGATVISDLENVPAVPHCILFWRASTHFLGGLGIIALFVALLGQGSAGKALMRAEMPGPQKEGATARMQHTAWIFAAVYLGLNVLLAAIYFGLGMSVFDALCHSFATMATGGFSTYNSSLAHFQRLPEVNAIGIEWVTVGFMLLAAINFTLLYLTLWGNWRALRDDIELRYFIGIWLLAAIVVGGVGWWWNEPDFSNLTSGARNACFTVASVLTTTGYATVDFDQWNQISRSWLLALMFIGGCSGSTGGGLKVIRHVLLLKILRIEIEHAFHPRVVRLLRLGGKALDDQDLRSGILVYFALVAVIFVASWLALVAIEPVTTWVADPGNKLVDSASAVAATLNNVGPGVGVVGPSQNFQNFCGLSKILFTGLMMLGRLELYPVLVLFMPQFWKDQ